MIEKHGSPEVDLEKIHEELICLYELFYTRYDHLDIKDRFKLINDIRRLEIILDRQTTKQFNNQL